MMHHLKEYMLLAIIVHSCLHVSGLTTGNRSSTACALLRKDIDFTFDLQTEGFGQKNWFLNSIGTRIAEQIGAGVLNVDAAYSGRVSAYGSAGITLSNVTAADSGEYLLVIYTDSTFATNTATTTLSVLVGANESCKPSCNNDEENPKCEIPEVCPAKSSVQVGWFLGGIKQSNDLKCTFDNYGKTYRACAEGDAVTACYGQPLCTDHICRDKKTSICIGVLVSVGSCSIILIFLFCCGCLDCCSLCRRFSHHKTAKCCIVTFYSRKKVCLEWFFCTGSKEEKGKLYCSVPKDPEVPLEVVTSSRQPSCLCFFCICCDPGQKEDLHLQQKCPPIIHTGTQNKVNSEITSNSKKSLDHLRPLPTLGRDIEDKLKHRPQPMAPGKNDLKDQHIRGMSVNYDDAAGLANDMARPSKLPPLLAGKQPTVDMEQPKRKKKIKNGHHDVKDPKEKTGED